MKRKKFSVLNVSGLLDILLRVKPYLCVSYCIIVLRCLQLQYSRPVHTCNLFVMHCGITNIFLNANCGLDNPILHIQLTLVISKTKGLFEILRDMRILTYQICKIEGKKINQPTTVHK